MYLVMATINRQNISEHLFEYQLSLIGKSVKEALEERNWKGEWYMNPSEFVKFKSYSIPLIKKVFKCNKKKAENTFNWFLINFGVKIYSNDTITNINKTGTT